MQKQRTSWFESAQACKKLREFAGMPLALRPSMWTEDELNRISREIIGAAITVHRRVGIGCLESAYAPCLALEFQRRKLDFKREAALSLRYDELVIPRAYVLDFSVEDCVAVELKSIVRIGDRDRRQLQT